jgi:hypothetical protein
LRLWPGTWPGTSLQIPCVTSVRSRQENGGPKKETIANKFNTDFPTAILLQFIAQLPRINAQVVLAIRHIQ